jgi:hypothetical protein
MIAVPLLLGEDYLVLLSEQQNLLLPLKEIIILFVGS